ncbi:MAG TPA: TetR/AcrR family transcriptional regulator, partial [Steroidobacteraceae bacterium]|nr:TetR/AcrR family transcriptional regulator [Steroidobacteraceae bacterium]
RLPAAEAAQIPERLLDAATALFTKTGYARTSMEAIAKQAGASSKTIYSRFASKEEVLQAVVKRLFDRAAIGDSGPVDVTASSVDPRSFLLEVGRDLANLSRAPATAGLNRLIMAEAFQVPELARLFIELHERACAMVREPLERWRASGALPAMPDLDAAAVIFVEMVASVPRLRALLGKPLREEEVDRLVASAVDLFLRGCGYRAARR